MAKLPHRLGHLFFRLRIRLARDWLEIAYTRFDLGNSLPSTLVLYHRNRFQECVILHDLRLQVVALL